MMMVPRSFVQSPSALSQRRRSNFSEKDALTTQPFISSVSSDLVQPSESRYQPSSDPVKIPNRNTRRQSTNPERPTPTVLQTRTSAPTTLPRKGPPRKDSVQHLLTVTSIPARKNLKSRQNPAQRLPNCDHVADFSKLLRDDVQLQGDTNLSGSWTNPQFEGLFGNIDGFIEDQIIVGSEGVNTSLLSARSISSDSMPSLASLDDFSSNSMASVSPATIRSPSDHRLRQVASSEDCSNQHPLLPRDDDYLSNSASTPELVVSSPSKPRRRDVSEQKAHRSFKSSLTASLKALRSAAQSVSNIATTPPLVPPDEFLGASIFDFKPELTDDRRPPPSTEPPSAAMRRYLNPRATIPDDSPAQLHFWLDEKPDPSARVMETRKPKLKNKKGNHTTGSNPSKPKNSRNRTAQLPPVVQLATCIPSTIRTAHASSPPIWLEPDGTPSNKHRAAQTLTDGTGEYPLGEGQPRPREPRENRDFLRVYVCELNMRRCGKLADTAQGHAKVWLPPATEDKDKKNKEGAKIEKKTGADRWTSWTTDDI